MWSAIVLSHEDALSFQSAWTLALDADHDLAYPLCIWKEPEGSGITQGKSILDAFTLQVVFAQKHTQERTTAVRDTAGTNTTGVILTFTVIDQNAPCVSSDLFPIT